MNTNINRGALSILIIFITGLTTLAQKVPMKFGKVDPVYFTMTSYEKDTVAEALVLGDYATSKIVYSTVKGFIMEHTRHFRAKIFKNTGYHLASNNIILFHSTNGKEQLTSLKGRVYNIENGKVVESELEKEMINEQEIDNKNTEKKFTLPNVREGSIIEYQYSIISDFVSLPEWRFQSEVPALWSEYRVSYPEYFYYKQLQKGYLNFDINEKTVSPINLSAEISPTRRTGSGG